PVLLSLGHARALGRYRLVSCRGAVSRSAPGPRVFIRRRLLQYEPWPRGDGGVPVTSAEGPAAAARRYSHLSRTDGVHAACDLGDVRYGRVARERDGRPPRRRRGRRRLMAVVFPVREA